MKTAPSAAKRGRDMRRLRLRVLLFYRSFGDQYQNIRHKQEKRKQHGKQKKTP